MLGLCKHLSFLNVVTVEICEERSSVTIWMSVFQQSDSCYIKDIGSAASGVWQGNSSLPKSAS